MRLMIHATAPWSPSSYSVLVNRTVPPMFHDGHEIILSTWYGLSGSPLPWTMTKDGKAVGAIKVLPQPHGDTYGAEILKLTYERFKADALITICDIWVFDPEKTHTANFCPWFPIDYAPLNLPIIRSMEPALYPMTYSKWGQQVAEEAGLKVHYVPCSAPTKVYCPGDRDKARSIFNIDRELGFLVTMVAANKDTMDRKGFGEALQGFAKFAAKHDEAMLYLHTNWNGPVNIAALAARLGIADRVIQPDQYAYNMGMIDENYMVAVYRASDVHLNTCKSEGFGLPLIESQMCGCPVIAPNYSTTDELLFAGWKIEGQPDWALGADGFRFRVFVDSVADALEEAYQNRDNEALKDQAYKGARKYDNALVFNHYWRPALRDIGKLVNRGKVVFDVAKGLNLESIQGRRRLESEPVPATGERLGLPAGIA